MLGLLCSVLLMNIHCKSIPYSITIRIFHHTFFLSLDLLADSLFLIFLLSFSCASFRSSLPFLLLFLLLALFPDVSSPTLGTEATTSSVGWFLGIMELQLGLLLLSIWFWDCSCWKVVLFSGGGFVPAPQYGNIGCMVFPSYGMDLNVNFRGFESERWFVATMRTRKWEW